MNQEVKQESVPQTNVSDKEYNFRALQAKYEKQLEQERQARIDLEKQLQQRQVQDDDHSDDPYVDEKRLNKKLEKFGQQTRQETQSEIQRAVQTALNEERKQTWMKNNSDFYDVMKHAQAFADKDPELAETILEMPDTFERQKLVYKNIKALGLHKPQEPEKSIQQKIDSNRTNPYYQPTGMQGPPYGMGSVSGKHYNDSDKKNAYDKMQELKRSLRI